MQASSNASDIASTATGPKDVLSVKCLRMGMNTPIWRQPGLGRLIFRVIAHAELESKRFRGYAMAAPLFGLALSARRRRESLALRSALEKTEALSSGPRAFARG